MEKNTTTTKTEAIDASFLYIQLVEKNGMKTRYADWVAQQVRREHFKKGKDYFAFSAPDNRSLIYYFSYPAYKVVRAFYENLYGNIFDDYTPIKQKIDKAKQVAEPEQEVEELQIWVNPIGYIAQECDLDETELLNCFADLYGRCLLSGEYTKDELNELCLFAEKVDVETKNIELVPLIEVEVADLPEDELAVRICISRRLLPMLLDEYSEKFEHLAPSDVASIMDWFDGTIEKDS